MTHIKVRCGRWNRQGVSTVSTPQVWRGSPAICKNYDVYTYIYIYIYIYIIYTYNHIYTYVYVLYTLWSLKLVISSFEISEKQDTMHIHIYTYIYICIYICRCWIQKQAVPDFHGKRDWIWLVILSVLLVIIIKCYYGMLLWTLVVEIHWLPWTVWYFSQWIAMVCHPSIVSPVGAHGAVYTCWDHMSLSTLGKSRIAWSSCLPFAIPTY